MTNLWITIKTLFWLAVGGLFLYDLWTDPLETIQIVITIFIILIAVDYLTDK